MQRIRRIIWTYMQPLARTLPPNLDKELDVALDDLYVDQDFGHLEWIIETLARYTLRADGMDGDYRSERARYLLFFYAGVRAGMKIAGEQGEQSADSQTTTKRDRCDSS